MGFFTTTDTNPVYNSGLMVAPTSSEQQLVNDFASFNADLSYAMYSEWQASLRIVEKYNLQARINVRMDWRRKAVNTRNIPRVHQLNGWLNDDINRFERDYC